MEAITLGQIAAAGAVLMALYAFGEFIFKKIDKLMNHYMSKLDKRIDTIEQTMNEHHEKTQKDIDMIMDINYQMLDHLATNNNTGGMKKCLDEFNRYARHN